MFLRALLRDSGGLERIMRAGDGIAANPKITTIATDADLALTVEQIAGGIVLFSSFSAGRAVTTPDAADILAAAPDMDIGDSFCILVSCKAAFAATWAAGTNVTLAGRATTPASTYSVVVVTKTSATEVTWTVL